MKNVLKINAFLRHTLPALVPALGLTACDSNITDQDVDPEVTIADVLNQSNFSTLHAAVDAADLTETLASEGPFTLFAPADHAFDALPEGVLEFLLKPENKSQLQAILTFHVIPGALYSGDVVSLATAKTAHGTDLNFLKDDAGLRVNEARVLSIDLEASNGVIHTIDSVLLPEWAAEWIVRITINPVTEVN